MTLKPLSVTDTLLIVGPVVVIGGAYITSLMGQALAVIFCAAVCSVHIPLAMVPSTVGSVPLMIPPGKLLRPIS